MCMSAGCPVERASDKTCFWGGTLLRQHFIPIRSIHRLTVSFLQRIRKISMLGDRPVDKRLLGGFFLWVGCTVRRSACKQIRRHVDRKYFAI